MFDENRKFRRTDPDFPVTPAVIRHLERSGRILEDIKHESTATAMSHRTDNVATTRILEKSPEPDSPRNSVVIGTDDHGRAVHIDLEKLLSGRLLVQGSSGAGKSHLVRRLVEKSADKIAVILVDPEGEFTNLAEMISATTLQAVNLGTEALTAAALRAREHHLSLHVDLSDIEPDERIARAAALFAGLVSAPREHWKNTAIVVVDEAHLIAPHAAASARDAESRRLGIATLTDLCSRGRKRGLSPVIATQRLAKLAASVTSELHNVMIGINVYDRDIARAADLLGYSYDRASVLRDLPPGSFYAMGPAISRNPVLTAIGPTDTHHIGNTPALKAADTRGTDASRELLGIDDLLENTQTSTPGQSGRGTKSLDVFILDQASGNAGHLVQILRSISPNATTTKEIARSTNLSIEDVDAALDLLSAHGIADTIPRDDNRIARLSTRLRTKISTTRVVGLA